MTWEKKKILLEVNVILKICTGWKVSKYGVISGPYFSAFGVNTERYEVSPYRKIMERKLISENIVFVDGRLAYNWKRKVTFDNDRKRIIIQEVYEGLENDPKAKTFAGHRGRKSTYQNLDKWHGWGPKEAYQKLPILSTTRKFFYND